MDVIVNPDKKVVVPIEELYTYKELADKLAVTVMTIYNWKNKRQLPFLEIPVGQHRPLVRFYLPDVLNWKNQQDAVDYSQWNTHKFRLKRRTFTKSISSYVRRAA